MPGWKLQSQAFSHSLIGIAGVCRRELRGNAIGREPLRGKPASERVSERGGFSEVFQRFFKRFLEVLRGSQSSEAVSPDAPNRVAP